MNEIPVRLTAGEARRLYWHLHSTWVTWRGELGEEGALCDWGDSVMAKLQPGLGLVDQLTKRGSDADTPSRMTEDR